MLDVCEVYDEILAFSETIDKSKPQRFPEAASEQDYFRQGDIYIYRESFDEASASPIQKMNAQVAEGDTKGSRHILDSLDGVTMYSRKNADVLSGPLLQLTKERVLTHPEHGDIVMPPGQYSINYQRTMAEELRRVRD